MEVWFYLGTTAERPTHAAKKFKKNLHPRSSAARRESSCPLDKDLSWKSGSIWGPRPRGQHTRRRNSKRTYTRAPPQRVGRALSLLTKPYHGSLVLSGDHGREANTRGEEIQKELTPALLRSASGELFPS